MVEHRMRNTYGLVSISNLVEFSLALGNVYGDLQQHIPEDSNECLRNLSFFFKFKVKSYAAYNIYSIGFSLHRPW